MTSPGFHMLSKGISVNSFGFHRKIALPSIVEPIPKFQQFKFWFFSKNVQFQFRQKRNHNNASSHCFRTFNASSGNYPQQSFRKLRWEEIHSGQCA